MKPGQAAGPGRAGTPQAQMAAKQKEKGTRMMIIGIIVAVVALVIGIIIMVTYGASEYGMGYELTLEDDPGAFAGCCVSSIIVLVGGIVALMGISKRSKAKQPPPPPYYPPQQYPPQGYPPQQQPPPQQPPPQQYPPQQAPPQQPAPSPAAAPIEAEPSITTSPPDAPQGCSGEAKEGAVLLKWNAPLEVGSSPISSFRLYRGDSPEGLGMLEEVDSIDREYEDRTVEAGRTYHYAVAAVSSVGEGGVCETTVVETSGAEAPDENPEEPSGDTTEEGGD